MVKTEPSDNNNKNSIVESEASNGGSKNGATKQRKRHRVPISCTICRRRKVKCDKKKPQCTNCKKNGVQHLCRYLEPKWAKPLDEDELKFSTGPSNDDKSIQSSTNNSSTSSNSLNDKATQEEIDRLKQKIRELETDNQELRKNSKFSRNNNNSVGFGALRNHIDTSDLVDCILSSNILFTAKPGPKYKFPIVYQISIFSWMFFVRNDSYLNDLWLKILKLRKHYEYYYSSQNAMKDAQKNLEKTYFNYDKMNNKISKDDTNDEKPVESSSKLKKLLEGSFNNNNNTTINNDNDTQDKQNDELNSRTNSTTTAATTAKCPVLHNQNSFPVPPHPMPPSSSNSKSPLKCPVTGQTFDSSTSSEHPHVTLDDKHTYHLVISKCPILHPRESTISYVMDDDDDEDEKNNNNVSSCPMSGKRSSNSTSTNPKKLLKTSVKKKKKLPLVNSDDLPNSAASANTSSTNLNELNDSNDINTNNTTNETSKSNNMNDSNDDDHKNNDESENDSTKFKNTNIKKCPYKGPSNVENDDENDDENDEDDDEDEEDDDDEEEDDDVSNEGKMKKVKKKVTEDDDDDNEDDDDAAEAEEDEAVELNEDFENTKVCPLMIGDARMLFKEKLARMSLYAMQEELSKNNSPRVTSISAEVTSPNSESPNKSRSGSTTGSSCPINKHNCPKAKRMSKKLKTISPSAIKNLNYNNTKQITQLIEKHLPTRKVVWLLINRYFDKLYIQLPFVDEESFRVRIASLIDTADSGSQKIRLSFLGSEYSEEFLTICLLLIIIRLSWLSLPAKTSTIITPDESIMLRPENTINMVLVDMVKEIFSSAKIMSKPSLIIFQVGLYLKYYNVLAPEDGFDLDDSYSSTSPSLLNSNDLPGDLTNESPNMNSPNFMYMLVQLGRTIGLNRDPLNFKNFYSQSDDLVSTARLFRKRHLWRKLWYGVLELSIEANLSLGDYKKGLLIEIDVDPTLGMVNNSWDCRLPGGVEQGILEQSFIGSSLKKEQIVVQNFRDSILVHHLLYKGMSYLFTNDSPPTSKEIDNVSNKLYEIISENSKLGLNPNFFLKTEDSMTPISLNNKFDKIVKIYKFRMFLLIKSMLFALNYLMFLNHEQKFNGLIAERTSTIAKLEKQKEYINIYFESSLLLAIDNFNIFDKAFENSEELFANSGAELILYPYLMILNHRSHEFLISLILRLQQNSPVIMEILNKNNIEKDELLTRLFNYVETFLDKLEGLSKNYYYAWRLRKLVKFFYNILTNSSKLFKINFNAMNASIGVKDEELSNPVIDTSTPPPPLLKSKNKKYKNGNSPNTTSSSTINNNSSRGNTPTNQYNNLSPLSMNMNTWNQQPQQPINNGNLQFTTHPDFNGIPAVSSPPPPPAMFNYSPSAQHAALRQQQGISNQHNPMSPQQLHPMQQQQQQNVHTPGIENDEQFNAFAIAFGTAKLPPVTDYNTPKQEFMNNPFTDMPGMNQPHMMFNENDHIGNNKPTMINLRQQAHQNNNIQNGQQLPPTPQQIGQHHHQQQQQQLHHQQQQQHMFHHHHQQQQQQQQVPPPTTPTGNNSQYQSQKLADIFDTRFFNELHDLQGDIPESNDMIPGFGDPNFVSGSNVMALGGGHTGGVNNNNNGGLDSTGMNNNDGGFGISYNPLNEIDFTNVDLSSPFDLNVNNDNGNGKYFNYK